MNQKILKKQLGIKSTLKLRDYYSARFDEDRPDFPRLEIGECVDLKVGDIVWVLSFKPNKKVREDHLNCPCSCHDSETAYLMHKVPCKGCKKEKRVDK